MILLYAVAGGLLLGWGWARWHSQPYRAPALRFTWLIVIGFIPQLILAYLPATRDLLPNWLAAIALSASLILFLAFVWINRGLPGMSVLLVGLLLNLVVMAANGGWMPTSPEIASRALGVDVTKYIALGSRIGQKDILLLSPNIHLAFLADRFLLPAWFRSRVVFSAGDILIAVGVFWLLARPPANVNQLTVE